MNAEPTLDVEYIMAIGAKCPITYVSINDGWIYEVSFCFLSVSFPSLRLFFFFVM